MKQSALAEDAIPEIVKEAWAFAAANGFRCVEEYFGGHEASFPEAAWRSITPLTHAGRHESRFRVGLHSPAGVWGLAWAPLAGRIASDNASYQAVLARSGLVALSFFALAAMRGKRLTEVLRMRFRRVGR